MLFNTIFCNFARGKRAVKITDNQRPDFIETVS